MIEFMFGVLGSVVFWAVFSVVGFFVGTFCLKRMARRHFDFITGNKDGWQMGAKQYAIMGMILVLVYFFWPAILFFLVFGLIFKHVFWGSFCKGIKAVDFMIPDIEIKKKG